jgi:ABC-type multidrug transport system fused ATPase/permease subunit
MMAAMGIGQSMVFLTDIKKARDGGARVYEVIDRVPLIDARKTDGIQLNPASVKGEVIVKDVNFRYPQRPDAAVFNKIAFSVKPGQTCALVGSSGCGKSTIIQVIYFGLSIIFCSFLSGSTTLRLAQ